MAKFNKDHLGEQKTAQKIEDIALENLVEKSMSSLTKLDEDSNNFRPKPETIANIVAEEIGVLPDNVRQTIIGIMSNRQFGAGEPKHS